MPEILDIILLDYSIDINNVVKDYFKYIDFYNKSKKCLDFMISEINKEIKIYYPDADVCNFEKYNTDLTIYNTIDEKSFMLLCHNIIKLPDKIIDLLETKYMTYYDLLIEQYVNADVPGLYLEITPDGLKFGLIKSRQGLFSISYDEMLMIIFIINYEAGYNYVEIHMKSLSNY